MQSVFALLDYDFSNSSCRGVKVVEVVKVFFSVMVKFLTSTTFTTSTPHTQPYPCVL